MNWTFTNDRPIYLQLTERLEREIASGTLAPGSWVPPVRELAGKLGSAPIQCSGPCMRWNAAD